MRPEIIAFIALVAVWFVATEVAKRYIDAKAQMLYMAGRYDECIAMLDGIFARIIMTTFKQYMMRFTVYEAAGNSVAAKSMLEHLLNMRTSAKRRAALVVAAFNFYAKDGDGKQAEAMLEEIKRSGQKAVIADCQLTYDIEFRGRHDMIDRMEKMVSGASPEVQGKLYMLIAKQYKNAGDRKQARLWQRKLDELVAGGTAQSIANRSETAQPVNR